MTRSECTTQSIETTWQSGRARQISQLRQTSARLPIGMGGVLFPEGPPPPPKPVALAPSSPAHQLFRFICDLPSGPRLHAILIAGPKPKNAVILCDEKGSG